jgi:hypothetical protein
VVERDLAKVEVASSTLVSRSKTSEATPGGQCQRRFNYFKERLIGPFDQTIVFKTSGFTTLIGSPAPYATT